MEQRGKEKNKDNIDAIQKSNSFVTNIKPILHVK